jgi:hypothetical protein
VSTSCNTSCPAVTIVACAGGRRSQLHKEQVLLVPGVAAAVVHRNPSSRPYLVGAAVAVARLAAKFLWQLPCWGQGCPLSGCTLSQ